MICAWKKDQLQSVTKRDPPLSAGEVLVIGRGMRYFVQRRTEGIAQGLELH